MNVWVLSLEITGPAEGDYGGWMSVHQSREGALERLFERYSDLGLEWPGGHAIATANQPDGSLAMDEETEDGATINWGIHNMPVED